MESFQQKNAAAAAHEWTLEVLKAMTKETR